MVPPLLPEDYYLTAIGTRFIRRRWLPLEYVKACAQVRPKPVLGPDDDICEVFDRDGKLDYESAMDAALRRYLSASEEAWFWREEWFTHRVVDGCVLDCDGNAVIFPDKARLHRVKLTDGIPSEWATRDRRQFQNCGRPFVDGQPTPINYYGYAPKVGLPGSDSIY